MTGQRLRMCSTVEFYRKGGGLIVAVKDCAAVPRAGEFVSIENVTWKIVRVTWAVDQPGLPIPHMLRANVEMELAK